MGEEFRRYHQNDKRMDGKLMDAYFSRNAHDVAPGQPGIEERTCEEHIDIQL